VIFCKFSIKQDTRRYRDVGSPGIHADYAALLSLIMKTILEFPKIILHFPKNQSLKKRALRCFE